MSGGSGTGHKVILPPLAPEESAFKAQMAADLAGIHYNPAEHAKTVIYTPLGGSQQLINAIIDYGIDDDYGGTMTIFERALLHVAASGTYGLALSKKGDTVTVDSVVWTVDLPKKSADGMEWEIELVK